MSPAAVPRRVAQGAVRVGVQSQPQRIRPGQADLEQVAQERIGCGRDVGGGARYS